MQTKHSTRAGCLVVTFTGQIDLSTAPQMQRTLLKDLAERPLALICDLSGVNAIDPVCATIFATVANHPASRWPATSVLLCSAQPAVAEILGRLTVPHFLPLYPTVQDALDAAVERPRYRARSCGWRRRRLHRPPLGCSSGKPCRAGSLPHPTKRCATRQSW
jgi:anti-sigma B factor antagonist